MRSAPWYSGYDLSALAFFVALAMTSTPAPAQEDANASAKKPAQADASLTDRERSPWLLAPVVNSNPKLGTSGGALVGYLHKFDEQSRPSIFALSGQYSTTESIVAAALARASFDEDHQRVIAGI